MHTQTNAPIENADIDILIVDDSRVIRMSLVAMLGDSYPLREASNGRDALAMYEEAKPDIMILDVNMPQLDGFGVVDTIRNELGDQETFIIVLTAADDRTVKPRILSLGANDFLSKPFERVELLARTKVAARQVRLNRQLTTSLDALGDELKTVGRLQEALLPTASPFFPGLAVDSLYRPSGHASGDYFDYFPVGDDTLRVVVADVSGHGARAACLMAIVRTIFHVSCSLQMGLTATMQLLNEQLLEIIATSPDHLTCFAADIHRTRGSITWCNAGHCPPLLFSKDAPPRRLEPTAPLMGFFPADWRTQTTAWTPASRLFCYTDGFFEWHVDNSAEEMLGLDRFIDLATALAGQRLPGQATRQAGRFLQRLDDALAALAAPASCEGVHVETAVAPYPVPPAQPGQHSSAQNPSAQNSSGQDPSGQNPLEQPTSGRAPCQPPAYRDDCTALWVEATE